MQRSDGSVVMEKDLKTGELTMVKSINSVERSPVRFTNKTNEYLQIIWIDYSGHLKEYKVISPEGWVEVNTFTDHPWIFRHPATMERFTVNNQLLFRAPPPRKVQNNFLRVNCNVCKPARSLQYASLLAVGERLKKMADVEQLNLPSTLAERLRKLLYRVLDFKESRLLTYDIYDNRVVYREAA